MLLIISARNYRYIMYLKKLRSTYLLSSIGFTLMFAVAIIINLLQLSQIDVPGDIPLFYRVFTIIGSLFVAVSMIMGLTARQLSELRLAFGCLLATSILSLIMYCPIHRIFDDLGISNTARVLIVGFIVFATNVLGGLGCLLLSKRIKSMIITALGFVGIIIASLISTYIAYEFFSTSDEGMGLWSTMDRMATLDEISKVFYILGQAAVCVGWWVSFAAVGKESTPYAVSSASSGQSRGTVPLANRQRSSARVTPAAYNPVAENGGYGGFSQNFDFGNQLAPQPQPASLSNDYKAKLKSATDSELMKILHDTTDKYSVEEQEDASMILFEKGSELLFGELRRYTPEQISEIANNPEEYFRGYVLAAKSLMKR